MKKFSKIILAMIMALQIALPQAVLAEEAKPQKVHIDFSTEDQMTVTAGSTTASYPTGQFSKPDSDKSLKLEIAENTTTEKGIEANVYKAWGNTPYGDAELTYHHFSMEFMPEDLNSRMSVALTVSDGTNSEDYTIMRTRYTASATTLRMPSGSTITLTEDAWNKIDVYIDNEGNYTFYKDDMPVNNGTGTISDFSKVTSVESIMAVRFYHIAEADATDSTKLKPTAVLLDNIIVEKTAEIPNPKDLLDFELTNQVAAWSNERTITYVDAQVGKSADDTSIRISVDENAVENEGGVISEAISTPGWNTNPYLHFSAQFLQEDANSGMTIKLGTTNWKDYKVVSTLSANPETVTFLGGATMTQTIGEWNTVDMYVDKTTGDYTVFMNGKGATGTFGEAFNNFYKVILSQTAKAGTASAVQFDNIIFEAVDTMPEIEEEPEPSPEPSPEPGVETEKVLVDFKTEDQVTVTAGSTTASYPAGQAGKAQNDKSLKLEIAENTTTEKGIEANVYKAWGNTPYGDAELTYHHFSMEFLPEDLNSRMSVALTVSDGTNSEDYTIMRTRYTASATTLRMPNGSTITLTEDAWNKIDVYIDNEGNYTFLKDGKPVNNGTGTISDFSTVTSVQSIMAVRFYHIAEADATDGTKLKPTSVQLDNIIVEKVAEIPAPKVLFDFETADQLDLNGSTSTVSYEKGQYAKSADDTSIRLATNGAEATGTGDGSISKIFGELPADANKNYLHFSMQFLQEDAKSGMTVKLGESSYWGAVNIMTTVPTDPKTVSFPGGVNMTQNFGIWNKVDVYVNKDTREYTVFMNGESNTGTIPFNYDFSHIIYKIEILQTVNVVEGRSIPSAMQFDNILFERVAAIPDNQDGWAVGEVFDFEDGVSFGTWRSSYNISAASKVIAKLPSLYSNANANPAFEFGRDENNELEVVGGYDGQPEWNKSIHSNFTQNYATPQGIRYKTGVDDLKTGEIGHLTFKVARMQENANCAVALNAEAGTMVYSNGDTNQEEIRIFETGIVDGIWKTRFYGVEVQSGNIGSNPVIPTNKWAKIDIIYKIGTDCTLVDAYIDGVKKLSNYELNNEEYLKYIGDLNFEDLANVNGPREYMVDDLAFGRFTEDTMYDPTAGYELTSDDEAFATRIDNVNKSVVLADNYSVADFLANVKEDVKVYTREGEEVTTGTIGGCVIETSNGFGGKTYFNVSSLALDESFDGSLKLLNFATANATKLVDYPMEQGGKEQTEQSGLFTANGADAARGFLRTETVVAYEGDKVLFEVSARPVSGENIVEFTATDSNGNSALQYIMTFLPNNTIDVMHKVSLEEKWVSGKWYKIAAECTTDSITIYLNGEVVYTGAYDTIADFEKISGIKFTIANGECGYDNLRISYKDYDPSVDLVASTASHVYVDNAAGVIGFENGAPQDITVDALKAVIVPTDKLTYDGDTVTVRKGETIKSYVLGYKTQEFVRPVIEVDNSNNVTATAELKDTANTTGDNTSGAVLILAIYDKATDRIEQVITDSETNTHTAQTDLTATIESCVTEGKYAQAFLWDGINNTLKPLTSRRIMQFDAE